MSSHTSSSVLFTADIHLPQMQVDHPVRRAFLSFLAGKAREASSLYILGDLFDGWLGDDVGIPHYAPILSALADYRQAGHELWIGHGNRDFLLKSTFFEAISAQFLADETEISLGTERAVLLHGDSLCTDDLLYQAFRQKALSPDWQAQVLALSVTDRLALLAKIKDQSRMDSSHKTEAEMDVTAEGLDALWQKHPNCQHIIHGHTHKPAHHLDAQGRHRWVLGDWRPEAQLLSYTPEQGLSWVDLKP